MPEKNVLQPVDADARRLARTLLRTARYGALATLAPDGGWPMASRISVATALDGAPVFLISQLSAHFSALETDARASLLLGEPGRGDPLAHPRMTAIGRAGKATGAERDALRRRFLDRHPKAELYADFADFAFWRLAIERVSLNGGFGKAFELGAEDVLAPVDGAFAEMAPSAVAHMNDDHADAVALYAEKLLGREPGAWRLTGLDPDGLDLARDDDVARLWFDDGPIAASQLRQRLVDLAGAARTDAAT